MSTLLELCAMLSMLASPDMHCPAPGEPLPEPIVHAILVEGGWPQEYMGMGMSIAMRETYWYEEGGVKFINPYQYGDGGNALGMWQIHAVPWHDYCGFTGDPWDPVQQTELAVCVLEYDKKRGQTGKQWRTKPDGRFFFDPDDWPD